MLMQKMNKTIAVLCVFLLAWSPTAAIAGDTPPTATPKVDVSKINLGKVSQIRKGQHAPFSGILLSEDAAARLFADIKFSERECQIRLTKELKINTLQLTSQIDALKLRLDIENTRTTSLLQVKDERIRFLEKNWRPTPWYESGEFWFAMGVVGGILITVGAAHAIGQAAK